ncbi:MAG: tRNA (N6-threonylcarbamoyladenosine(37)-N6)-methyltransferase TrmO [Thermoplasmata archaeon]
MSNMELVEIGTVVNKYEEDIPRDYRKKTSEIHIREKYSDSLLGIEEHSHIVVLCWLHKSDRTVHRVHPMRKPDNPLTGVFATRSPVRPNPISITVCRLVERKENVLVVEGLDAYDDTPVIDLKSYTIKYAVESPEFPDWLKKE